MPFSDAAEIYRRSSDLLEIEVLPLLGARLHRIRVRGHDVLLTPPDVHAHRSETFFWGAYNMAPWCNRLATGPVKVGERTVDLQPNFRDGSAIHGQVYDRPWTTVGDGEWRVSGGDDGWPWQYEVSLKVTADGPTVTVDQQVRNLSSEDMPAGVGLHPWFAGRPLVAIQGEVVYPSNTDSPPLPQPVAGDWDLRKLDKMKIGLDATWADIRQPAVMLDWPDYRLRAVMTSNSTTPHITAANPADIFGIAIEPQTHAPQGLRRLLNGEPGSLAWLAPKAALSHSIAISFEPYGG